jgi:hypothetical protein
MVFCLGRSYVFSAYQKAYLFATSPFEIADKLLHLVGTSYCRVVQDDVEIVL